MRIIQNFSNVIPEKLLKNKEEIILSIPIIHLVRWFICKKKNILIAVYICTKWIILKIKWMKATAINLMTIEVGGSSVINTHCYHFIITAQSKRNGHYQRPLAMMVFEKYTIYYWKYFFSEHHNAHCSTLTTANTYES